MRRHRIVMALALSTVIAAAAVVFLVLHEPSRVAGWREKAARLDKHCVRVLLHYESERWELADLRYRAQYMERLRETQPHWKPDLTNLCTQEPIDTSHRIDCLYRRDFECLIAFDVAIETAIKQR